MKKIVSAYDTVEAHLLVASLAFTTMLVFVQVVLRYVFNNSLSWSEELARYIFIWQIWLGTSVAMKEGEHITLDMLPTKLGDKGKLVLAVVTNLLMLAFCVWLAKNGWDLVASMMRRGNRSTALDIPMWIVYLSLPLSQLMIALRLVGRIADNVRAMTGVAAKQEKEGT